MKTPIYTTYALLFFALTAPKINAYEIGKLNNRVIKAPIINESQEYEALNALTKHRFEILLAQENRCPVEEELNQYSRIGLDESKALDATTALMGLRAKEISQNQIETIISANILMKNQLNLLRQKYILYLTRNAQKSNQN